MPIEIEPTNKTIVWTVKNSGGTGLTSAGLITGKFTPASPGILELTATITNGLESGNYTQDFTITISGTAAPKTLTGIAITQLPNTTLYPNPDPNPFTAFDRTGLVVEGIFSDETTRTLTGSEYTIDAIPNPGWIGVKVVTVRAVANSSFTAQFQIVVDSSARTLNSISVTNSKPVYYFGENFDKTKLTITGHFSDGDANVSADSTILGYDKTKRGAQTVTVRINGKNAAIPITLKIPASAAVSNKVYKSVYIKGQDFDFSNVRFTITANGTIAAVSGIAGDTILGYSKNTAGNQTAAVTLDDKTGIPVDVVVIDVEPHVYFDYGYMRTSTDPLGKGSFNTGEAHYTAVVNRPLVLAPVRMLIGYNADNTEGSVSYSWSVSGPVTYTSANSGSECFTFTPTAAGTYTVTVNVTGRNFITGATDTKTATTKVVCGTSTTADTFPQAYTGAWNSLNSGMQGLMSYNALKNFAPGQFIQSGTGYGWSLGAFGGYMAWRLPASLVTAGVFNIRGNPFPGWSEPGVVWVSYDDNGNDIPDDTWYELKGSHEGKPTTVKRFAMTYRNGNDSGVTNEYGQIIKSGYWADSQGRTGTMGSGWPKDWGVPSAGGEQVIYTGTLLCQSVVNPQTQNNFTGYVDAVSYNTGGPINATTSYSKNSAIQANGTGISLTRVSFVKVQCGIFDYAGALGEISTEIYSGDGIGQITTFPLP
jgi:hypothetical protein